MVGCGESPQVVMDDGVTDSDDSGTGTDDTTPVGTGPRPPSTLDGGGFVTDDNPGPDDPCAIDGGCGGLVSDAGPACGDGEVTVGEECDDGNSLPGDGCSGACRVEPNSECPPNGGKCKSTIVCGDGKQTGSEVCDDGNTEDGDGCSKDCLSKHPDWDCSVPGEPCENLVSCGDGVVGGMEACDDGGELGGCAEDCSEVEEGWICLRPGEPCALEPRCGDGLINPGEQCDDTNEDPGDGCSDSCVIEDGFYCPVAGVLCVQEVCGDGARTPSEQCDDGNVAAADGCSDCTVDMGYVCPVPGALCFPSCGDGQVVGTENCDDGNTTDGDGCGGGCLREAGYECPSTGGDCSLAVCGDGMTGGDEGCDDGAFVAGDGCGPTCQIEPTFNSSGVATLACGDGLITGGEQCDDGNATAEDGCSDTCKKESGWNCGTLLDLPESVEIAVTYRDFKTDETPGGHPDFEDLIQSDSGIPGTPCEVDNQDTCGQLDSERKPVLAAGSNPTIDSAASFALWFRDEDPANVVDIDVVPGSLLLDQVGGANSDVYEYDSNAYFPIDANGETCGNEDVDLTVPTCCNQGEPCDGHNYHFTTELRYFFQYQGGETLTFRGDDDVWVFINGRLAVDVGGVHCAQVGRVVLGDENSDCSVHGVDYNPPDTACQDAGDPPVCDDTSYTPAEQADDTDDRFGITKGGVYEIVLFHAERHTQESNFRLTLAGFLAPRSTCTPICGDGVVQRGEVCDDGDDNVAAADAVYGACVECRSREFCGDGKLNGPELCDNGLNISAYDEGGGDACSPGCVLPPYCGDAMIAPGPEWCDDGTEENDGRYNGCTATCELGPYCGDGNIDEEGGETCDDGLQNGDYGRPCAIDCQPGPYCGDGERNGPEQCDLGEDGNTGEYETCNEDCTLAPRCGDGQRQVEEDEECDDGVNDGGYGECAPGCKLGPRCGDGEVQGDEQCDDEDNDGGYGECAPGCVLGPRCGDFIVQKTDGEQCDEGPKGSPRCSSTCKNLVPDPSR